MNDGNVKKKDSSNSNDDNVKKDSSSNDDNDNINNELSNINIDSSSHRSSDRNCLYCLQVVQGSS